MRGQVCAKCEDFFATDECLKCRPLENEILTNGWVYTSLYDGTYKITTGTGGGGNSGATKDLDSDGPDEIN